MSNTSDKKSKRIIHLPHLDDFLLSLKVNNFSEETIYNYERDLKVFQGFLQGINTEFDHLRKKDLLNYKAYLTSKDRETAEGEAGEKKLSSFSINRMLSALRSYLRFLIDMDHKAPVSPEMVKLIKTPRKNPRISQFQQIVNLIESPTSLEKNERVALRNRAMLEMLFSTGMRISELINLKRQNIDKQGRIFVRGKGKKERFVYLTPRAKKHLNKYLSVRGNCNSPYVFIPYRGRNTNQPNKRISPNYLQEKIKKYRQLLGINVPVSAHTIRHAFATFMAEKGASVAALRILLGHESLDTTTRYVNASDRFAEKTFHKFHPLQE